MQHISRVLERYRLNGSLIGSIFWLSASTADPNDEPEFRKNAGMGDVLVFYSSTEELATLEQWTVSDRFRYKTKALQKSRMIQYVKICRTYITSWSG